MRDEIRTYTVSLAFALAFFVVPTILVGGVRDASGVAVGVLAGVTGALAVARIVYDHSGVPLIERAARDYAAVLVVLSTAGIVGEVAPGAAILVIGAMVGASALLGLGVIGVIGSWFIGAVLGGESR